MKTLNNKLPLESQHSNETDFGLEIGTDAQAPYQSSNEGGIVATVETTTMLLESDAPRLVTRGESFEVHEVKNEDGESFLVVIKNGKPKLISIPQPKIDGNPRAAIVDYLNCSFHLYPEFTVQDFFSRLLQVIGKAFAPIAERKSGIYGYNYSFTMGKSKALFAYGGNGNTGFLSFSGESCHSIPNWTLLVNYLEIDLNAKITRWDGAYDDYEGERTVDDALKMYQEGLFTNGGRKPLMDQRGNWVEPDGRGRTLYIGSSENGKLTRIYEKGMQQGIPYHP